MDVVDIHQLFVVPIALPHRIGEPRTDGLRAIRTGLADAIDLVVTGPCVPIAEENFTTQRDVSVQAHVAGRRHVLGRALVRRERISPLVIEPAILGVEHFRVSQFKRPHVEHDQTGRLGRTLLNSRHLGSFFAGVHFEFEPDIRQSLVSGLPLEDVRVRDRRRPAVGGTNNVRTFVPVVVNEVERRGEEGFRQWVVTEFTVWRHIRVDHDQHVDTVATSPQHRLVPRERNRCVYKILEMNSLNPRITVACPLNSEKPWH